jgi:hypothetical protein
MGQSSSLVHLSSERRTVSVLLRATHCHWMNKWRVFVQLLRASNTCWWGQACNLYHDVSYLYDRWPALHTQFILTLQCSVSYEAWVICCFLWFMCLFNNSAVRLHDKVEFLLTWSWHDCVWFLNQYPTVPDIVFLCNMGIIRWIFLFTCL